MFNKEEFIRNYSHVTAQTWASDDYLKKLIAEPKTVLAEAGIQTRPDARINVITMQASQTGSGSLDGQVQRWVMGEQTGVYDFVLSLRPEGWEPGNVALSDMQLDAIAGGAAASTDVSISCCCCTPCTCCT